MNSNDLLKLNIIFFAAVIVFLIISIIIRTVQLKRYQKNNFNYLTKYLEDTTAYFYQLKSEVTGSMTKLTKDVEKHTTAVNKKMDALADNHSEFFNRKEKEIGIFITNTKLNFEKYKQDVANTNKQLTDILVNVQSVITLYREIKPIMEGLYKSLESLNDITKSLVSNHERLIKDEINMFESLMSDQRKFAVDKLQELSTISDKSIKEVLENSIKLMDGVLLKAQESISSVLNNSSLLKVVETVETVSTDSSNISKSLDTIITKISAADVKLIVLDEMIKKIPLKKSIF